MKGYLPMNQPLTQKQDGQRVCVDFEYKGYSYPKYIFTVLVECGFSYDRNHDGISFVHNQDIRLQVLITVDHNQNWHHLISYRHSKWTLTYEGDVEYHIFGNDVLKTIRKAYDHWHGL
jgi:hypothetical protein